MKRRKLKKNVKTIIKGISILAILFLMYIAVAHQLKNDFKECDSYYKTTCSVYEMENFKKGVR